MCDSVAVWRAHGQRSQERMYYVTSAHVTVPSTQRKLHYEMCVRCISTIQSLGGDDDVFFRALARTFDTMMREAATWDAATRRFVLKDPSFTCAVCLEPIAMGSGPAAPGCPLFVMAVPCAHMFCGANDCVGAKITQSQVAQCPLCRAAIASALSFMAGDKP